jgi:hypothetical protein
MNPAIGVTEGFGAVDESIFCILGSQGAPDFHMIAKENPWIGQ